MRDEFLQLQARIESKLQLLNSTKALEERQSLFAELKELIAQADQFLLLMPDLKITPLKVPLPTEPS
jgi:hypothetical protein